MALGLGSLIKKGAKKDNAEPKNSKATKKSSTASDEAAELLKKMDEKAASGDCPFC